MTNNNIWDCADMRPMISAKWSIDDSSVFYNFFFLYFWYVSVFVIHVFPLKKIVFDSLALDGNLLGPFVGYS
jgi:hypothetical protein